MGEILQLKCENNDLNQELSIGQGIQDNTPENIINYFPKDKHEKIINIIKERRIWVFHRVPAMCRRCSQYVTVPLLEIKGDDPVRIAGNCSCGHSIRNAKIIDTLDQETIIQCPECGGRVSVERVGFWD